MCNEELDFTPQAGGYELFSSPSFNAISISAVGSRQSAVGACDPQIRVQNGCVNEW